MNIRTMYRIAQSIENIINDIVDENVTQDHEVLEYFVTTSYSGVFIPSC
jgi:hypothetical protein